jgi:hypothetical protein
MNNINDDISLDDFENLNTALEYAEDFYVLPMHYSKYNPIIMKEECSCGDPDCKGKHPSYDGKPTQDQKQIKEWWMDKPDANVGIKAGRESYYVLEVDNNKTLELPKTYSESIDNGTRYYFESNKRYNSFATNGINFTGDDGFISAGDWYRNQTKIKELPEEVITQLAMKSGSDGELKTIDPIEELETTPDIETNVVDHNTEEILNIIKVPSIGNQQSVNEQIEFWGFNDNKPFIDHAKLKEFIEESGVIRYEGSMRYAKIEAGIIGGIEPFEIKNIVLDHVENNKAIWNMINRQSESLFSKYKLSNIKSKPVNYIKDTKEKVNLFYQNNVVEVGKEKVKLIPYENITQVIHREHKLDRNFDSDQTQGLFEKFVRDTSKFLSPEDSTTKKDNEGYYFRPSDFESKMLAIGYLCSRYKDPSNLQCIIATDGYMSNQEINGRTGKSLFIRSLNHIRKQKTLDGKLVKLKDKFSMQGVKEYHQSILIDDVDPNFDFQLLFNMLSEDMMIEEKYMDRITIPAAESAKIAITTNYPIGKVGTSVSMRQHILEFSNYYNEDRQPIHVLGKLLFDEFDDHDWHQFDTFIIRCIQKYLNAGELKEPKKGNYKLYKLGPELSEFCSWADTLPLNIKMNRKDKKDELKLSYPKYKEISTTKFKIALKAFCMAKGISYNAHKNGKDDRNRVGTQYITLT